MRHRDKKLVFTNGDNPQTSNEPDDTEDPDYDDNLKKHKIHPIKNKRKRPYKFRKSTRIASMKYIKYDDKLDILTKEPNNETNSDTSDEEIKSNSDEEIKLDEETEKIRDELMSETWFNELSDKKQVYYIEKIRDLMTYKEKIPSTKEIIDLKIDPENIKILLVDRKELDFYDKLDPVYEEACRKFLRKFNNFVDTNNAEKYEKINSMKKKILNQTKFIESMRDRILNSDFDDKIKSIMYEKYITMTISDPETAPKYLTWIETALSIPQQPKKIVIDASIPLNQAISNLMVEMMDKLNKKIYGMDEAKEELLCMVANMIGNPSSKYKAIGLYGPPGIGKTMIAKIMSEVLELPMEQIALGGIVDSNFLEGHSFTYIGSEPGCITKSFIKMKYTNGIIFLDELDKISQTDKGKEIEHSLLHITDFTQNHDFRDKYMPEIPINLSNIIFIYSMNTISGLDSALASRIPVIKFDGYTSREKIDIVKKYIMPEILDNYGIGHGDVIIGPNEIQYLVQIVKEEDELDGKSGVRGLKKALDKIINRINLYKVASTNGKIDVKLSFDIPNFKLPFVIDSSLINKIIKNNSSWYPSMYPSMYL
ncbi:MAG: hypothetical protein Satyrvirus3_16 [Satyrvirus sp.]|uniref:AAA+ ATPase domain-containing protein n=1 Tax=Satyrvirus sp. TaxID=2487771 RepID=A0A3G5ACY8_9VIRU|nr:MAG: hypothetical protein Satyrvirus3_16 [Satyrvirus sp.]